ncbi:MAG: hypothetical protein H7Y06_03935 [Opitutaceae bacterium]|nr:hypothetical protein [Opitutaceae bacterium]
MCLVAIHEGGFIGTITIMPHDPASPTADLIAMYGRWGYAEVGRHRRDVTDYR